MFPLRRPSELRNCQNGARAQGFASPRKTRAPLRPPLRSGRTVNRDGWLRREHDEDDQFAGIIYLRKGTSVSPLDKLIMEVLAVENGVGGFLIKPCYRSTREPGPFSASYRIFEDISKFFWS